MAEPFDPYRKWLGIPPKDQPPHYYRLLGVATFEDDPDVIENAAARQMSHVRTFQTSKQHGAISQRILTELSAAKLCLLTPDQKSEYDERLRARLAAAGELSSTDLTGAVAAEAAEQETAEPDLPPLRREGELRWRTGVAVEAAGEPPPVPIPMPPVGTGAAASTAVFPAIRRSAASATGTRGYRKRSALPVVLMVVSLVVLAALGTVALVVVNQQGTTALRPKTKAATSSNPSANEPIPGKNQDLTGKPARQHDTPFPVGTATDSTVNASPAPIPATEAPKPTVLNQSDRAELVDQMRQALFLTEQALKDRKAAEFGENFKRAEQVAANKDLPDQAKYREQVDDLRVLKQLNDEFWTAVRDYALKLPVGERIEFQQHKFELVARDGETLEYVLNGQTHKHEIGQLEPVAAVLVASKAIKWEEPVTFLPIAAFLSVDARITDDSQRQFGKQLFAIGRLIGQANPAIARKLGLKDVNEEIKLDEDLATKLPLPKPE